MRIVAFGHQKNVGKDTAAKFLTTHARTILGFSTVRKIGFADKLKSICFELYSWAGLMPGPFYEEPHTRHLKEIVLPLIGKSPRRIWIDFGQSTRERVYNETWSDYLFMGQQYDLMINSDLRFPHECDAIHKRGGKVYLIERPSIPHTSDEADDPLLGYPGWDGKILNDSDFGVFYARTITTVFGATSK